MKSPVLENGTPGSVRGQPGNWLSYRDVQHILPKGFQRVRYMGLHAVSIRQKIKEQVRQAIGAVMQEAFYFAEAVMRKFGWR